MSLWGELKRRNVIRVAVFYLVASWLVIQVAETVLPLFQVPEAILRGVVILLAIGFIPALIFSWAFELTPEGLRKESAIAPEESISRATGQKLNIATVIVAVLAIALMAWDRLAPSQSAPSVTGSGKVPAQAAEDRSTAEERTSIAVLPFVNMSASEDQEYFSDGMTEEIINALVRVPELSVAARTSVFAFKDRQSDVRRIGEELGVNHILEGSVRSSGKQVRITAQLIQVEDGFHLWSETFDRELTNVFAIQDEIARAIADQLALSFSTGTEAVPNRTERMDAYDAYLQGRALLRTRKLSSAVDALAHSVELDPDFAPAWAALAIAQQVYARNRNTPLAEAERSAHKALELDPDNVDALTALASVYRDRNQWSQAAAQFERALTLDPNSSELLEDYAEFLGATAQFEKMLEVTTRGYRADPLLGPLMDVHVSALIISDRIADAKAVLDAERVERWWSGEKRAQLHFIAGDLEGAIEALNRIELAIENRSMGIDTEDYLRKLGRSIGLLRNPNDAELAALMLREYRDGYPWDLLYWSVLNVTGWEREVLAAQIDREHRGLGFHEDYWMPEVAKLRRLPGFAELLELRGLPAYWDQVGWPALCRREGETIRCH